jgi:hypothetical protein
VSVTTSQAPKRPVGASHDPRHEPQVRLRLVSSTSGVVLSTGVLIDVGEQTVDVPQSEAERLLTQVRDEGDWLAAERHYAKKTAEWCAKGNAAETSPYSVEGSYYTMHSAAPGWITELEILDDDLPPECTEEDRRIAAIHARTQAESGSKRKG